MGAADRLALDQLTFSDSPLVDACDVVIIKRASLVVPFDTCQSRGGQVCRVGFPLNQLPLKKGIRA